MEEYFAPTELEISGKDPSYKYYAPTELRSFRNRKRPLLHGTNPIDHHTRHSRNNLTLVRVIGGKGNQHKLRAVW